VQSFSAVQFQLRLRTRKRGRVLNPFLLDLLDYPFDNIIGLQLWEIGLFEDIAANQAAFEKLRTEEYIRYEKPPAPHEGQQADPSRVCQ